jgi:MerR family transcriptional regulator, copper efflux regulator
MRRQQTRTMELAEALRGGLQEIGAAAEASGVSVKMIRHYQKIGLMPRARRTLANYRVYGDVDVHALRFIRSARELGFTMRQIEALLALWRNRERASADVKTLALEHVDDIERRIEELTRIRDTLLDLVRRCHGDHRPECPILARLSQS